MRALLVLLLLTVPLALVGCDSTGLADFDPGCTLDCGDGGDPGGDDDGGDDSGGDDDGGDDSGDDDDGGDDSEAVFLRLSPTATYLRTEAGDANASPAVALGDLGLVAGETACFRARGDVDFGGGATSADLGVPTVLAVFSRSDELLDETEPRRVTGALDAGEDVATPLTNPNELRTDIDEDFDASDVCVGVPDDAAFVFFSAYDSFFLDNLAVGDYGIEAGVE